MKRSIILLLIIVIVGVSCKKKQTPLTEEEVIAVVKRFDEGWIGKNLSIVDSVLAPSYIYFTQSGSTFNRKNLVETAGSSEYLLDSAERLDYRIKLFENTYLRDYFIEEDKDTKIKKIKKMKIIIILIQN